MAESKGARARGHEGTRVYRQKGIRVQEPLTLPFTLPLTFMCDLDLINDL